MLLELDFTAGITLLELLPPDETVAVRGEAGEDVVAAVAVYVVGIHLRAALVEGEFVLFPNRITGK